MYRNPSGDLLPNVIWTVYNVFWWNYNYVTLPILKQYFTFSFLAMVSVLSLVESQKLTSTLHNTKHDVKFAYVGETVIFTCMTVDSSLMGWSSNEYIGTGGTRFEFVSVDPIGTIHSAGQTVSELVTVSSMNGVITMESQLKIVVLSAFQIATINCHKFGNDTVKSTSFQITGTQYYIIPHTRCMYSETSEQRTHWWQDSCLL